MKDEIKAVGAISSMLSFAEKALIAFFMMLMEFSRIKAKKAEDALAKRESEIRTDIAAEAIDKANEGKSSAEVIDNFLDGDEPEPPGKGK